MSAKKNYSFRFQESVINDIKKIVEIDKEANRDSTNLIETILIRFIERKRKAGLLK